MKREKNNKGNGEEGRGQRGRQSNGEEGRGIERKREEWRETEQSRKVIVNDVLIGKITPLYMFITKIYEQTWKKCFIVSVLI